MSISFTNSISSTRYRINSGSFYRITILEARRRETKCKHESKDHSLLNLPSDVLTDVKVEALLGNPKDIAICIVLPTQL